MSRLVTGVVITALACAARPCAAQATTDSTLAAACAGGGTVADGLLVVVFRPELGAAEQAAIARGAGLTLVGPAGAGSGTYYLRVPDGAGSAAADRVIGFDGVEAVGAAACPPPPSSAAPTPAPGDTAQPAATDTAAPDSAAERDTTTP